MIMKILIGHNDYAQPSGEEYALESLAALLERHGHSVLWLRRSSKEIGGSIVGKTKALFSGLANPWAAREMATTLEEQLPDLALIQNIYPFLSPSILAACQEHAIPVVMRCPNYRLFCPNGLHLSHGQVCERCLGGKEYWCFLRNCLNNPFKSFGYALRNEAARISGRILNNVNTFIVLSEFQKMHFMDQGIPEERLAILPNIAPVVKEHGSHHTQIKPYPYKSLGDLIGFVGRASPEKGIEDFVAAAYALPEFSFAVAGAADRIPHLLANSPKNLKWMGFLRDKELDSFYGQCRIVVLPSLCFEGFPNTANYAMMMRKPVIASRIGAIAEIVEDEKTGLLFEMGNVDELVGKIRDLYHDPERCRTLGNAGRMKAETEYGSEVVYKRLMAIFEKALRNREMAGKPMTLNVESGTWNVERSKT
jgi:glycosyltransferase involved in cell wall biosynthesis